MFTAKNITLRDVDLKIVVEFLASVTSDSHVNLSNLLNCQWKFTAPFRKNFIDFLKTVFSLFNLRRHET